MIKIVKITTQKNNKERFNIFVDCGNGEEYGFSVDQDVLIEYQLKKGKIIEEEEIEEMLHMDDMKKAYNLALNYLSYRMRSEKEVRVYLLSKEYPEDIINTVLQKLKNNRYINDLEFAKSFVRSRMANATKGPLFIRQELLQKGVSEPYIQEGLKEFPEEKQLEIAIKFAQKNAKQKKTLSDYQIKQKIGQALSAKGFSQQITQNALAELVMTRDEEEQMTAIKKQGEKAFKKYSQKFEGWELKQKVKQYLYQRGFRSEDIDAFLRQAEDETD